MSATACDAAKRRKPSLGGAAAVEGDGAERRIVALEAANVVVADIADRCIAAAFARARRRPRPTSRRAGLVKACEALRIIAPVQILADGRSEQPPELVGGKGVIAAFGEGSLAGQAAEDEQARDGSAIGGSPDLTLTKKPLQPRP